MPESWEGVAILFAVTVITVGADIARRRLAPPHEPAHYSPAPTVSIDDYVRPRRPAEPDDDDHEYGGGEEDEGA